MHALLAWQWAGTVGVGGILAAGVGVWGAWLPAMMWIVATASYVWASAPPGSLDDREALKALALGSGARSGLGVAVAFVAAAALRPGALGVPFPQALLVAVLLGAAAVPVLTILTLVGLDAGRTPGAGGVG